MTGTFVVLGLNVRDAEQEWKRLLTEEPERVAACDRSQVTSPSSRFEGLRVQDFEVTLQAGRHPKFREAYGVLHRAKLRFGTVA